MLSRLSHGTLPHRDVETYLTQVLWSILRLLYTEFCQNEVVVLDPTVCLRTGTRASAETLQCMFPLLTFFIPLSSHFSCFFIFQLFEFRKSTLTLPQSFPFTRNGRVQLLSRTPCPGRFSFRPAALCHHASQNTAPSDAVYTIPYKTTIPVTTLVPVSAVRSGYSNNPSNSGGGNRGNPSLGLAAVLLLLSW